MRDIKVLTAKEAVELVKDNDCLATSGFVSSCIPEALNCAIEEKYLECGSPKNLTMIQCGGPGNQNGTGMDRYAHKGMLKRIIAGHWNMTPVLGKMAIDGELEAYNLPQGTLSQVMRAAAAHQPGVITHVGLNTFVDPRVEGGKINSVTTEDLVEVVTIDGEEKLLYKAPKIDVCFLRGTTADEWGNVTLEHEVATTEVTAIAQAVKNNGGTVIVQVERIVKGGTLDPKLVKIPGIYVDVLVKVSDMHLHEQCLAKEYDGSFTGEFKAVEGSVEIPELNQKMIIGRRGAMELRKGTVVNLGIGIPEYVSMAASEKGISDYMTLTVEAGPIGGIPMGGPQFGGSVNVEAIINQNEQFDFYDGGGIDDAFLGLAQADEEGNINVSKFGTRLAGCGGFINITQNAKRVFFLGTFTTGGLKIKTGDGKLEIVNEGRERKFIKNVEQITFSAKYAKAAKQPVMYITERAVFELREDGLHLTEIAPGIDLQTQVLDLMDFKPIIDDLTLMDEKIFMK